MKSRAFPIIFWMVFLLAGCQQSQNRSDIRNGWAHIPMTKDPSSLDPRLEKSMEAKTVFHALYEGLMRYNMHGDPIPAIAEKVELSPDKKTYTFTLKKTRWSNGDPLTAQDFVSTWRQLLEPDFPSVHTPLFYIIKGAREAKKGIIPVENVGIQTPDPYTLIIELESPTPYFLDLLATHYFFPMHSQFSSHRVITNGPFALDNWQRNKVMTLVRNPKYWDANEVRMQKLYFVILDEYASLNMFEGQDLEWAGSPMSNIPQDIMPTLKYRHQLRIVPAAGIHWLRINTDKPPLQSSKLRRALAYAIDRKSLTEKTLQGNQKPALSLLPGPFKSNPSSHFQDYDTPAAWYLFQEALEEMRITKDTFPSITLCYLTNTLNNKIANAIQEQWTKTFNIEVLLEGCERAIFSHRLIHQEYQIALDSFFAEYKDPFNFLEIFKNNSSPETWNHAGYTQTLRESSLEAIPLKRKESLAKAEDILMQQMPVIPLFFDTFAYAKSERLFGVYFSDLGYLDFKYSFYEE